MAGFEIKDMDEESACYVATCTHGHESAEVDASAERRAAWFAQNYARGLRIKVASVEGEFAGFIYVMPIEISPWGPAGRDLLVAPCLVAHSKFKGRAVGRALVAAAEGEARAQGRKGLVIPAFYWPDDFWFMPAPYFERLGFAAAAAPRAVGLGGGYACKEVVLWKVFDETAEPPAFATAPYTYKEIPGKVVVDLFYNTFCMTSDIEAQRVREVAAAFGDAVVLRERLVDCLADLRDAGRARGIFVNGREISWGYEAPKEGIADAIRDALERIKGG